MESLLLVLLISWLEDGVALLKILVELLLLRIAHILLRILIELLLLRVTHVLLLWISASLLNQIEVLVSRAKLPVTLIVLVSSSGCSLLVIGVPSGF